MVAANPDSVDGIAAILDAANAEQKQAVGAGLGQAAKLCARAEPGSAQHIQEAVLKMNKDVVLSYRVVTGDNQTASTGGGAGGGGGGGGGTGVSLPTPSGGSSSYFVSGTSIFPNLVSSFSGGSGGFAGLVTGNSTITTGTSSPTSAGGSPAVAGRVPSSVSSPSATVSQNQ